MQIEVNRIINLSDFVGNHIWFKEHRKSQESPEVFEEEKKMKREIRSLLTVIALLFSWMIVNAASTFMNTGDMKGGRPPRVEVQIIGNRVVSSRIWQGGFK